MLSKNNCLYYETVPVVGKASCKFQYPNMSNIQL